MARHRIRTINGFLRVFKKLVERDKTGQWSTQRTKNGSLLYSFVGDNYCQCPLTFVCHQLTHEQLPLFAYDEAAKLIGMEDHHVFMAVVHAADNDKGCDLKLRQALLKIALSSPAKSV